MCKDWLSAYGYDSHGKIHDLKARIIAIKKDSTQPQKIINDSCCSIKVNNNLIGSLLLMIFYIMMNEVTDESIFGMERDIKLFPSNFHIFQRDKIAS